VYIGVDPDEGAQQHIARKMPWYTLPFKSGDAVVGKFRKVIRERIPAVLIMDEKARLLNREGLIAWMSRPKDFPWRYEHFRPPWFRLGLYASSKVDARADLTEWYPLARTKTPREMLGTSFLNNRNETFGTEALEGKILGLYVSANWCKPCQVFSPRLASVYNSLKAQGKNLEVSLVCLLLDYWAAALGIRQPFLVFE
jgi:hypothetical protein